MLGQASVFLSLTVGHVKSDSVLLEEKPLCEFCALDK